jgi:uncharacterized membrane protein (DUF373 family)
MVEERSRRHFGDYLGYAETAVYSILAMLLIATALVALASATKVLFGELGRWPAAAQTLKVLDELLVVLMLVEILHTVRISIRSHMLAMTEPFLVVGLIASIRRILVITLEAATLGKEGAAAGENALSLFRNAMVELGLLGGLVLIFTSSIIFLRRFAPASKDVKES